MVDPMPDAIADETAAQLIAMPLSALMLLEFLQVGRGQWIVQNAANGAVGKALAMLAATRGLPVLGLVRRADSVGEMAALGGRTRVVKGKSVAVRVDFGGRRINKKKKNKVKRAKL